MAWSFGLLGAALKKALPATLLRAVNSRTYGGLGGGYVDSSGNSYISVSNSNGGSDGGQIVQKLSPTNSVLWSYTYPNAYGGEKPLHADTSGNLYVGGFHGNSPGDYYLVVNKYTPSGTNSWQRSFGGGVTYPDGYAINKNGYGAMSGGAFTSGRFVLLDPSGNTVFTRSGNLGNGSGEGGYNAGMGPNRVFFGHLLRFNIFDLSGNFIFGGSASGFLGGGIIRGLADASNNVYVWSTDGSPNVYITKFSPTGVPAWSRIITAPSGQTGLNGHGDTDADGNIYIPLGWASTYNDGNSQKIVWVSFDPSGNLRYGRSVDVANARDSANSINIDSAAGRGYVGGYLNGNQGALISFDTATGNAVTSSANAGGVTATMSAFGWSMSSPSLTYGYVGDIGGSTSVSSTGFGSSGGSGQYTFSTGTFG
jgi:hypothetical protein